MKKGFPVLALSDYKNWIDGEPLEYETLNDCQRVIQPFKTPFYQDLAVWDSPDGPVWLGLDGNFLVYHQPGKPDLRVYKSFNETRRFQAEGLFLMAIEPHGLEAFLHEKESLAKLRAIIYGAGRVAVFGHEDSPFLPPGNLLIKDISRGEPSEVAELKVDGVTVFKGRMTKLLAGLPGEWGVIGQSNISKDQVWITSAGEKPLPQYGSYEPLPCEPFLYDSCQLDNLLFKDSKPRWKFQMAREGLVVSPTREREGPWEFWSTSGEVTKLTQDKEDFVGLSRGGIPIYLNQNRFVKFGNVNVDISFGDSLQHFLIFIRPKGELIWTGINRSHATPTRLVFIDGDGTTVNINPKSALPSIEIGLWLGLKTLKTDQNYKHRFIQLKWNP